MALESDFDCLLRPTTATESEVRPFGRDESVTHGREREIQNSLGLDDDAGRKKTHSGRKEVGNIMESDGNYLFFTTLGCCCL